MRFLEPFLFRQVLKHTIPMWTMQPFGFNTFTRKKEKKHTPNFDASLVFAITVGAAFHMLLCCMYIFFRCFCFVATDELPHSTIYISLSIELLTFVRLCCITYFCTIFLRASRFIFSIHFDSFPQHWRKKFVHKK